MDLLVRAVDWVVTRKVLRHLPSSTSPPLAVGDSSKDAPSPVVENTVSTVPNWESLPGDIFTVLLRHIDSTVLVKNLRSTCSTWRHHIDTQLQHLSFRINKQSFIRPASEIFSNIRSLSIHSDYEAAHQSSTTLRDICSCSYLNQLSLRNCKAKLLEGVCHLERLTSLAELHLDGDIFQKLRLEGVRLFYLKTLCLYQCSSFKQEDFRYIGSFTSINRLVLTHVTTRWKEESSFLSQLTNLTDLAMMQYTTSSHESAPFSCLKGASHLRRLVLHEAGICTESLLTLPLLPSLEHLTLDGCLELSQRSFQILSARFPQLESLRIICQPEATIAGSIGNVHLLQCLRTLDLFLTQDTEVSLTRKTQLDAIRVRKIRNPDWTLQKLVERSEIEEIGQFLKEATETNVPVSGEYFTPSLISDIAASKRFDVLKLLVECGADIDYGNPDFAGEPLETGDTYDCSTALHFAVHRGDAESVKELLNLGARVNAHCSEDSRTSLHLAASNGHVDITRMLIAAGADVNAVDYSNRTPLHMAVTWRAREVITELLENDADSHIVDLDLLAPICYSARMGDVGLVRFLVESGMDVNEGALLDLATPLHVAARAGMWKVMQFLINHGADPRARDVDGTMPLLLAARHGHRFLVEALLELLEYHKEELDERDTTGNTLLHYAAVNGWTAIVERCIQLGVDVNRTDPKGFTALYYADQQRYSHIVHRLTLEGGLARWLTQPKLYRCPRIGDRRRQLW